MESRDLIVAAIAASVASGCVRCLEFHKTRALAAGVTEDELLEIATLAFKIRDKADEFNRGELDALLTENLESERSSCQCCGPSYR
ncbi:MAG TPA: carboxymuconolactone decarboxylase family protein [Candidatus Lokiarchaeia archaeon]|nr:carboxymuconolactone decarboxylase family protein [Candidatus Lokiarchaeia archaeon]